MRLFRSRAGSHELPPRPSRFASSLTASAILPWLSILAVAALVLVPLGLLGWLIFFTDVFVVQAVTVTDARPHTIAAAKKIIEEQLSQNPASKNIFFIPTDTLEQSIIAALPQVRTVYVARKLPGTVKAIIQEKVASLLLLSKGKYYFVDAQGIAYEEARLETLPGTILPIVKNNDTNSQVTVGIPVVAKSFVEFVTYMEKELPAATGGTIAEIRIPSLSAREVHLLLSNNWVIRFDVTRSADVQLATLQKLLAGTISPDEQKKLDYIDMRIPDRVYYKTHDVPAPTPRPTPTPTAGTP